MAAKNNLPCGIFVKNKKCDGELILVDGSNAHTRLRCNKCTTVVFLKISLMQFARDLNKWRQTK